MPGPTPQSTTHDAAGSRRLSPAIIAFIVLDVLLVVAAVALGLSMGSDGSDAPSASSSASSPAVSTPASAEEDGDEAAAPTPEATLDPEAKQVASPSGNITCTLSPGGAECAIASLASEPAAAEDCDGVAGYVVALDTSGVSTPCAPEKPGKANAAIPVLAYGEAATVNNFECVSTEAGMKCSDTNTGQGFTLARAGITRF